MKQLFQFKIKVYIWVQEVTIKVNVMYAEQSS